MAFQPAGASFVTAFPHWRKKRLQSYCMVVHLIVTITVEKVGFFGRYHFVVLLFCLNGDQNHSNSLLIAWFPTGLSLERSGAWRACGPWQPQQMVLDQILESGQGGHLAMRTCPAWGITTLSEPPFPASVPAPDQWLWVAARLEGHWSSDRLESLSLVTIWVKNKLRNMLFAVVYFPPGMFLHDLVTNAYVITTAVCSPL